VYCRGAAINGLQRLLRSATLFHPVVTASRLGSVVASTMHTSGSARFSAGSAMRSHKRWRSSIPQYNTTGHVEQKNRQGFAAR
jgi:hypothetical protein